MGLVERAYLVSQIAPPLDNFLATQLIDEFTSMERRFIQRDWEPAELDGGQFSEVLARILYHMDSGNLNRGKDFSDCLSYVEDENNQNQHAVQPRRNALHLAKVLRTIYKFRSQRGGVHISPTYTPTHMDSKLLIECVRWCMNETLRIFWQGDREKVAKAIRELLQFDVPCIGKFEDVILVQRTDLAPEEEILVLLHYAGERGFSRKELGQHSLLAPPQVTRAIQKLVSADCRQIVLQSSGAYQLTDLGSKRIREELADKLLLQ
jgi:hypothetical protein